MLNKVKLRRLELELTQQQLAEMVGVTRQTINLIEKDKYNPTLNLCLLICYALQRDLDSLFWRKEEKDEKENI